MIRDLDALSARTHDVLIVGGGIYGLTIACDAAQRGLSVALIERDDFGSGASFNHLRTIHGGLRYLQTMDVGRARESMRERRTVAHIAPHTIRPLLFALPLYRSITRGRLVMRAGFLLDALIARNRNRGVPSALRLPGGRVVSRAEAIERFPGLRRHGLAGAATWHDYVTVEPDRLTFSWAIAAAQHGATLANHVDATALIVERGRVTGVTARDVPTDRELEIGARLVVNATGAAVDRLLKPLGVSAGIPLIQAMNLVTRREAGDEALGGRTPSGRTVFMVPWRSRALFGTWESSSLKNPDDRRVAESDIAAFIADLNSAFPALDLTPDDVTLVHAGLVPAVTGAQGVVALQGREQVRDHLSDGIEGLISVCGVKYTTARAVAERVTTRACARLGLTAAPCRTHATPLPGGGLHDVANAIAVARREYDAVVPPDTVPHAVAAYGTRHGDVLRLAAERPEWRTRLAPDSPVIGAQLVWAVRHEMAETLADAAVRRTPLAALGRPGEETMARAAAIVGDERGWSDERRLREIAAVLSMY